MAASGGKERRRLSVDRELQAVGNNWTVNGQRSGNDGSGSEDGEMDVGRGSLDEWKVINRKRKTKDRDESDYSDIDKEIKTVKRSEDEFKVFIKLLQEGTTFNEWSPIQLSKSLHKDIGEISGVAMVSKMSPSFASLYVGLFESNVIFNTQRNPFIQNISYWKRYLDDIFFKWDGGENELQAFHTYMGENNQYLRFTMSVDKTKMNFLDILVIREGNVLKTNLYRKSTDRNSLLHGESYHPTSLKKNLPISQFSRIRRICSSEDGYQSQSTILKKRFKERGYKDQWIGEAADRFKNMSQDQCLNRRTKNNKKNGIKNIMLCTVFPNCQGH
ncbi:uncharacterized protein LOC125285007 [Alosa alosa]|uniref:uncharacterized protein LOC125285007 n=1 Tax=Alosa alosa TaxID=278164 RepID=UPI002015094E|nr:uncharacterized protein LOC125285007 [Alosa alosa]